MVARVHGGNGCQPICDVLQQAELGLKELSPQNLEHRQRMSDYFLELSEKKRKAENRAEQQRLTTCLSKLMRFLQTK